MVRKFDSGDRAMAVELFLGHGLDRTTALRIVQEMSQVPGVDLQGVRDSVMYLTLIRYAYRTEALYTFGFSPVLSDVFRVAAENCWLDAVVMPTWGFVMLEDSITGGCVHPDNYLVMMRKASIESYGVKGIGADNKSAVLAATVRTGAKAYCAISARDTASVKDKVTTASHVAEQEVATLGKACISKSGVAATGFVGAVGPDVVGYCYLAMFKPACRAGVAASLGPRPALVDVLSVSSEKFESCEGLKLFGGPGVYHVSTQGEVELLLACASAARAAGGWPVGTMGHGLLSHNVPDGFRTGLSCYDLLAGKVESECDTVEGSAGGSVVSVNQRSLFHSLLQPVREGFYPELRALRFKVEWSRYGGMINMTLKPEKPSSWSVFHYEQVVLALAKEQRVGLQSLFVVIEGEILQVAAHIRSKLSAGTLGASHASDEFELFGKGSERECRLKILGLTDAWSGVTDVCFRRAAPRDFGDYRTKQE